MKILKIKEILQYKTKSIINIDWKGYIKNNIYIMNLKLLEMRSNRRDE